MTDPKFTGPPECDPTKTLVERLRIAADREWSVRVADSVALMLEAALEIETLLGDVSTAYDRGYDDAREEANALVNKDVPAW